MRSDVAIVLLAHRDCSLLTSAGDESCIPKRNDLAVGFAVSRGCVMLAPAVAPGSSRTSGLSVEVVFLAMCVTHYCTHMTGADSHVLFHTPYEVGVGADGSRYADGHHILHATQNNEPPSRENAVALAVLGNGPTTPVLPPASEYAKCRRDLDTAFCNNVSIATVAMVHREVLLRNQTLPLFSGMWGPASWGPNGPARPWHCYSGSLLDATKTHLLPEKAFHGPSGGMTIPKETILAVAPQCPNAVSTPTNFTYAWSSATDGLGRTWHKRVADGWRPPFFGMYHTSLGLAHDVGNAVGGSHQWGSPPVNISSENSTWANFYTATAGVGAGNVSVAHEKKAVNLHFRSLPQPVMCAQQGPGADCFWSHSNGKLQLQDKTYFSTVAIPWICGWTGATKESAGIFAFRSNDSIAWELSGTIAQVADFDNTGEGPNENDASQLPNGDIIVVMRVDGGDGTKYCHRPIAPKNYHKSISTDNGVGWTKPSEILDLNGKGVGCARPRLLSIAGILLLSGGRVLTEKTIDIRLWVSVDGGHTFATHSISYEHNRLVKTEKEKMWWQVNSSDTTNSTTGYTSLLPVDAATAILAYDTATTGMNPSTHQQYPQNARQFFMPLTILQKGKIKLDDDQALLHIDWKRLPGR